MLMAINVLRDKLTVLVDRVVETGAVIPLLLPLPLFRLGNTHTRKQKKVLLE